MGSSEVHLFDAQTFELTSKLSDPRIIEDVAWRPDGEQLAIVGGGNASGRSESPATVLIWDVNNGNLDFELNVEEQENIRRIFNVAWTPDGTELLLGLGPNPRGSIPVLNPETMAIAARFDLPSPPINSMIWNSDGTLFAVADRATTGSTLYLWDGVNDELLSVDRLESYQQEYFKAAWQPNENRLGLLLKDYSIRGDGWPVGIGSVTIRDMETQETIGELVLPEVNTATPNLFINSLCSTDPNTSRVWQIRNEENAPIDYTWDVVGTDQTGSGTVPANGTIQLDRILSDLSSISRSYRET